jgi:uncharacterized protein YgfB (UPF0149 family)
MSSPSLPDFERTLQLGQGNLDAAELAECHGLMCGLLCRGAIGSASDLLTHLAAMKLLVDPPAALAGILGEACESTVRQLDDEELGFALWLPDDDDPLEERTVCLGQWCSGFLAGLGSGGQLDKLSDDAREAVTDLLEISRVEATSGSGLPQGGEEEEAAYAEIVEYVRVVTMTLHEEFRGPDTGDVIH